VTVTAFAASIGGTSTDWIILLVEGGVIAVVMLLWLLLSRRAP
jgi:hypothetical protein